ncbi:MAG: HAD family hydrolase [Betaproteobacteria bacterium]|nr:HAD family hydrolase [Betaproteobacteria bacterium]
MTSPRFRCILFDWGGTLMSEDGPEGIPMSDWPEVRAIEGARATLAALAPKFRLGLATNAAYSGREAIEQALDRVALRPYITDIFCFREIGGRKETPQFWAQVLKTLDAKPHEVAMIGDSPEQDVLAPRREGIFSVWFNPQDRNANVYEIPVIRSLPEVVPLLTQAA